MPFYRVPYPYIRAELYAPQMTREQEPDSLRSQAEAIKRLPVQIDARIKELGKSNGETMKIAISATSLRLDPEVNPRFGRCHYFVTVDPKNYAIRGFP